MDTTWQKYLAEFFGTFILVLMGTMTVVAALRLDNPVGVMVPLGFGLGLLLACMRSGRSRAVTSTLR